MKQVVISISRQYGSGGRIIARKLSEALEVLYYDKEIVQAVAERTARRSRVPPAVSCSTCTI